MPIFKALGYAYHPTLSLIPNMTHEHRLRTVGAELIAGLGLVFVLAGVIFWSTTVLPAMPSTQAALHELVMHVLFGVVILALGIHTERSDLKADE